MSELLKRIFTSIILFPPLFISIYLSGTYLLIVLIFFYFICLFEIYKNTKKLLFNLNSNIFLIFAFYSFYSLRGNSDLSMVYLFWVLSATFLSDIGGYVIGRTFNGKKLTKISPNKTYSGSFGSILFSTLSIPIMHFFQVYYLNVILINFFSVKFLIIALIISIICQLGDLYVSYLKRQLNIKDISNFLPGHGGVLDRIDGLIFVIVFINLLKKFV